jgi:hypothetical protein
LQAIATVWLATRSSGPMTHTLLQRFAIACTALLASGCATMNGNPTQQISIQTVDQQGHVIEGMSCRVSSGAGQYVGNSPMFNLEVRRSSSPLLVECRGNGQPLARAVLISRADVMFAAQMLLPGGTSLMVIDHLTGFMYAYPRWIRLQAGSDMVFDRRDEAGRDPTPGLVTRQFDDYTRFASGAAARID